MYAYMINTNTHTYTHTHTYAHTHTYKHTDTHTLTHIHTHTQVETSSTYGGKIAGYLTGGLNFQIEHHLFPRMSSAWYGQKSKIR